MVNEKYTYCEQHARIGQREDMKKAIARQARKPFAEAQRPNERHYHNAAHRKWAAAVIARDKACVMCGATDNLQADHIKPLELCSQDEGYSPENGQALCRHCHARKTALERRMLQ